MKMRGFTKVMLAVLYVVVCFSCYMLFLSPGRNIAGKVSVPASGDPRSGNEYVERLPAKDGRTYVVFHGVESGTNAYWYLTSPDGKAIPENEARKILTDNYNAYHIPAPSNFSGTH